jgi:hypothetical protein
MKLRLPKDFDTSLENHPGVVSLDKVKKWEVIAYEEYISAALTRLLDEKSPIVEGAVTSVIFRELKERYGDDAIADISNRVIHIPQEQISDSQKTSILIIAHLVIYANKMKPSAYLVLAMSYANRSQNEKLIQDTRNYLMDNFDMYSMEQVLSLWESLIQERLISKWELSLIQTQIWVAWRQLDLF